MWAASLFRGIANVGLDAQGRCVDLGDNTRKLQGVYLLWVKFVGGAIVGALETKHSRILFGFRNNAQDPEIRGSCDTAVLRTSLPC